jgi:hypothetical protein
MTKLVAILIYLSISCFNNINYINVRYSNYFLVQKKYSLEDYEKVFPPGQIPSVDKELLDKAVDDYYMALRKRRTILIIIVIVAISIIYYLVVKYQYSKKEKRNKEKNSFEQYKKSALDNIKEYDSKLNIYPLKFNGLYELKKTDCSGTYFYYLRFYPDGIVISTTTSQKFDEVLEWFKKEMNILQKGEYFLNCNNIKFTIKSSFGEVEYEGILVNSDSLIISSFSHINKTNHTNKYIFKSF